MNIFDDKLTSVHVMKKKIMVHVMAWCHDPFLTWANVNPELYCCMTSLGNNELNQWRLLKVVYIEAKD